MGVGIVPTAIIRVGDTMMVFHLSIQEYLQDGERTIETIVGKVKNGTTSEWLIRNCNRFIKEMFKNNLE